jgi:electron transport complex protein RnfB
MEDIYKQLALHLDKIPNGFPATESGVEQEILAKLFTREEAALACEMSLVPESAGAIAQRIGREEREVSKALKAMVKKGLIDLERGKGSFVFKLIPFIVGFYERQNANIDEEFARLFEKYYQEALYKMMTIKPSVHRVIPIEKTIPINIDIMPYERASFYIENAQSWGVLKCICRVQKSLVGQACQHTVENCIVFSSMPNKFDRTDRIRTIDKKEALQILEQADKEGLVHSANNVQDGVDYICNCCACSCGVLRGITQYGSLDAVAGSDFFVEIDDTACTGCSACIDRCQFKALKMIDELCQVDLDYCYGCGLCVSTCPSGALQLKKKSGSEIETPPRSENEWRKLREEARKGER